MSRDRDERVRNMVREAMERTGSDREAYLSEKCGSDRTLRQQVEELLNGAGLESDTRSLDDPVVVEGPQPGEMLRHYRVVRQIGRGGMGVVCQATDTSLDREVAVKILPEQWATDPRRVERFRREARVLASLNHPNIVVIHAVEELDRTTLMVMELIDGRSLRDCIPTGGLPLSRLLEYAIQIADALSSAHARGVTHRDLKPENVMVTSAERIKVLDFGIARRERQARDSTDVPLTGQAIVGTLPYMSPEQLQGATTGPRSDLFSFGTLLYEMAVGQRPFQGGSAAETAAAILRDHPPAPSTRSAVPPEFDEIVRPCMRKNPEDRPETAEPVRESLVRLRTALERAALRKLAADASSSERPPGPRASWSGIAVFPLLDLSRERKHEHLCVGIAEEIASALSRVTDLRVSVLSRLDRRSADAREMGRLLGVPVILDGSVRQAGEQVRVTVRLVNVADGTQIWQARFDRAIADVFAMQDEVARAVAETFDARLAPTRRPHETHHPDAYATYLRGRYFWNRRYEDGLRRALEFFSRALSLDPTLSEAHVGRADCFVTLAHFGLMDPKVAYARAAEAAQHALNVDSNLAEAHATMGWLAAFRERRRRSADDWFRRAIELDPNYATAWHWNGINLVSSHRQDEAIRCLEEAQRLEPLSLMISSVLGWMHYESGRHDEALRILRNALELDPRFVFAHNILGVVLLATHREDEAVATFERGSVLSGAEGLTLAFLGYAYGRTGRTGDADRVLRRLHDARGERYVSPVHLALPCIGAGRLDEGIDLLEEAVAGGDSFFASMHFSLILNDVRDDSRFRTLVGNALGSEVD